MFHRAVSSSLPSFNLPSKSTNIVRILPSSLLFLLFPQQHKQHVMMFTNTSRDSTPTKPALIIANSSRVTSHSRNAFSSRSVSGEVFKNCFRSSLKTLRISSEQPYAA